jgi:tRNA-dihydrouridine synthase 1
VRPLPKEAMAKGSITLSKQEKKKLQRERESAVAKTEEAPNGGATGDASSKRENDGAEGRPTQRDCQPAWRKVGATNG